jgi:hypothetical protein
VQGETDAGVPLEQIEEGPVAVEIGLLEDTVKVADRLVIVEDEDEPNGRVHCVFQ